MKEFIDKLKSRLEEAESVKNFGSKNSGNLLIPLKDTISIVNELADEYKCKSNIIDDLKIFLQKKFDYCAEQAGMNLEAECNSEIASYFRDRKELYLDRANIYGEVMREIDRLSEEYKGECCEWKIDGVYLHCQHDTELYISCLEEEKYRYNYCPICGKKIKVVE